MSHKNHRDKFQDRHQKNKRKSINPDSQSNAMELFRKNIITSLSDVNFIRYFEKLVEEDEHPADETYNLKIIKMKMVSDYEDEVDLDDEKFFEKERILLHAKSQEDAFLQYLKLISQKYAENDRYDVCEFFTDITFAEFMLENLSNKQLQKKYATYFKEMDKDEQKDASIQLFETVIGYCSDMVIEEWLEACLDEDDDEEEKHESDEDKDDDKDDSDNESVLSD